MMDCHSDKILPDYWSHITEPRSFENTASHSQGPEFRLPISRSIYPHASTLSAYSSEETFSNNPSLQPSYAVRPVPTSYDLFDIHNTHSDLTEFFPPVRKDHNPFTLGYPSQGNLVAPHPTFSHLPCNTSQELVAASASTNEPATTNKDPEMTNEKIGSFMCEWNNCRKHGPFQSKGSLMRHIDTQHVAPRSYRCSDKSCMKSFNRKDNLEEHIHRVHGKCLYGR